MSIAENLRRVQERIARAAESAGRRADEIRLVGVTKYVGPREALELVAAGCTDLGESRPQELWRKVESFAGEPASAGGESHIRWHLVGHLQRNKVRRTLPLVSLIHSIDSERLLAEIDKTRAEAADNLPPARVLLEVNTSGESAKHGLAPDAVEPLLAAAPRYPHVVICGLMTMAALEGGTDVAAKNFAMLRELRERLKPNVPHCVQLDELSMGMSSDFEVAIREGATIVRIGSLLWDHPD
jgi:pyridoxal phosphate enzyme (YggS family)